MKRTTKKVKHEVETTEVVCELTREEFEQTCAEIASSTVIDILDGDLRIAVAVAMTELLVKFSHNLKNALFNEPTTNDKKEEQ